MEYLNSDDLLTIYRRVCGEFHSGSAEVDSSLLDEIVTRPQLSYNGYEPFPSLWEKAAVLLETIVQRQPFGDGQENSATGLLAIDLMLRLNGYYLQSEPQDVEYLVSIAMHQITVPQIAAWIESKSARLELQSA